MTVVKENLGVYKNFINGSWREGSSEEYYDVRNPANMEEIIGRFPLSTGEDIDHAISSANNAFKKWRKVPASERASYIYKFIELYEQNQDRLATALSKEQGKPIKESRGEVGRGINEMRYVAGEAVRLEGLTLPSDRNGVLNLAIRVPIGVVVAINPWNFPVLTPLRKIIPALISGCTVVFKPATETPLTSVILTELLVEAGLPAGTINLVMGKGKDIGDPLVENQLIKGISFTGSTKVGQRIYHKASNNFKKVQLELGGNNPAAVFEYNDLENAATEIVNGCYSNAGQRCTSIGRLIVYEKHADQLEELIINKVKKLKVGDGFNQETDIGPVINQGAMKELERIIRSAKEDGASVVLGGKQLTGGQFDKGHFFEPTIITDVTPDMEVAKEEIFGPVLIIIRVSSFEELIEVSNNTQYGLTSAIFTDKMEHAYRFLEDMEAGMVHINNGTSSEGHMPFGGVKNSGVGPYSIGQTNKDFYTDLKVSYIQHYKSM